MSKIEGLVWVLAWPSKVYPAGKLQWCNTCGFDLRHGLALLFAVTLSVWKGLIIHVLYFLLELWVIFHFGIILCRLSRGLQTMPQVKSLASAPTWSAKVVDFKNKMLPELWLLWWFSKLWTNEEAHYRQIFWKNRILTLINSPYRKGMLQLQ